MQTHGHSPLSLLRSLFSPVYAALLSSLPSATQSYLDHNYTKPPPSHARGPGAFRALKWVS